MLCVIVQVWQTEGDFEKYCKTESCVFVWFLCINHRFVQGVAIVSALYVLHTEPIMTVWSCFVTVYSCCVFWLSSAHHLLVTEWRSFICLFVSDFSDFVVVLVVVKRINCERWRTDSWAEDRRLAVVRLAASHYWDNETDFIEFPDVRWSNSPCRDTKTAIFCDGPI